MPRYEILVNGQNYLIEVDGAPKRMGFFVRRYVEADTPETGELAAIELVRRIDRLNELIRNESDDPPVLYMEEMYELDSFDDLDTLEPGISFYPEDDADSEGGDAT